jgi:hypothetical protein
MSIVIGISAYTTTSSLFSCIYTVELWYLQVCSFEEATVEEKTANVQDGFIFCITSLKSTKDMLCCLSTNFTFSLYQSKNMKKCSLAIKEMQVKTALRFHLILVRIAVIKNTNNNKC